MKQVICIKKTPSTIPKARTKTSSTAKTKTMSEDSFYMSNSRVNMPTKAY